MANVQRICDLIGQEDYNIGRIILSVWERNSHLKNKQIGQNIRFLWLEKQKFNCKQILLINKNLFVHNNLLIN